MTHSALFGDQIPTRSPSSTPEAIRARAPLLDPVVELGIRPPESLVSRDERESIGMVGNGGVPHLTDRLAAKRKLGRSVNVGERRHGRFTVALAAHPRRRQTGQFGHGQRRQEDSVSSRRTAGYVCRAHEPRDRNHGRRARASSPPTEHQSRRAPLERAERDATTRARTVHAGLRDPRACRAHGDRDRILDRSSGLASARRSVDGVFRRLPGSRYASPRQRRGCRAPALVVRRDRPRGCVNPRAHACQRRNGCPRGRRARVATASRLPHSRAAGVDGARWSP